MTDNRNRTVADVRHAFSKFGGNLGADGSVSYLFKHVGLLSYPPGSNEDAIMAAAIDAGAEDVMVDDDKSIQVLTDPLEFETVRDAMQDAGFPHDDAGLTMWAATTTELGLEEARSMVKLLEALEDLDDVQNVYSNADIRDEVLSQI
jgi:YebC/PmpR family DNA-binding regulatory protein